MGIISLRAVSKSYPSADTRLEVLREVDLEVEEGEFAVVAGPSGSGKSTLLNLMGGPGPPGFRRRPDRRHGPRRPQ